MKTSIEEREILASKILVADDNLTNLLAVERTLEWAGFVNVKGTCNPEHVVDMFYRFQPDLMLLDLHMPKIDGFALLQQLREIEHDQFFPILVLTDDASTDVSKRAFSLGASDLISKSGEGAELALRVKNFLQIRLLSKALEVKNRELESKVKERTLALWQSQIEILERLAKAVELRDDETGEHTKRVGEMSAKIARQLGWDKTQAELLRLAAPLHDVGKVGISDRILLKPGKLTPEEEAEMVKHTTIGGDLLRGGRSPLLQMAEEIAMYHHEKWDGTGYPKKLLGDQIPMCARIVAVADVFDALTQNRPYKKAWTVEEAFAEIVMQSGQHFDPAVVKAFVDAYSNAADRKLIAQAA